MPHSLWFAMLAQIAADIALQQTLAVDAHPSAATSVTGKRPRHTRLKFMSSTTAPCRPGAGFHSLLEPLPQRQQAVMVEMLPS